MSEAKSGADAMFIPDIASLIRATMFRRSSGRGSAQVYGLLSILL